MPRAASLYVAVLFFGVGSANNFSCRNQSLAWESSLAYAETSKLENKMFESLLQACQLWAVS